MPRGRPDPFSQVADGGGLHLVPGLEILEQDRAQLDEPQRRLATGDDGVHTRAVAVVRTDATIAIAIESRGITARSAVTLAGDQIDERCFLSLLHGLPLSVLGKATGGARSDGGPWGGPISAGFGTVYGAKPLSPRGKSVLCRDEPSDEPAPLCDRFSGRGTSCIWLPNRTSTGRFARSVDHSAYSQAWGRTA